MLYEIRPIVIFFQKVDFEISHERTVKCPAAERMLGKSPPPSAVDDNIVDGGMCYKAVYSQQYSAGPIRRETVTLFRQDSSGHLFIYVDRMRFVTPDYLHTHRHTHFLSHTNPTRETVKCHSKALKTVR